MKFSSVCATVAVCCGRALLLAPAPPDPCNWNHTMTVRTHGRPGYSVFVKLHHLHLHRHDHLIIIAIETEKPTTAVTHWQ